MCVFVCTFFCGLRAYVCVCDACVRVQMFHEISSGEPDERNASVSKIEIATTILRVSTI